ISRARTQATQHCDGFATPVQSEIDEPRASRRNQRIGRIWPMERTRFRQNAAWRRVSVSTRRSGVFKGIRGELFSRGRFTGILERIGVRGDTDTPDFQVKSSTHAVDLRTRFQALVDAKNGDTQLQEVQSHFWNTTVQSQGSVARRAGQKGKEAVIHMAS